MKQFFKKVFGILFFVTYIGAFICIAICGIIGIWPFFICLITALVSQGLFMACMTDEESNEYVQDLLRN